MTTRDLVGAMVEERLEYLSYLLRLWPEGGEEKAVWRASLESPHTGERVGFASLDELFDFLRQQTSMALDTHEDGSRAWNEAH